MKWELNERGKLIKESVHYECQNCRSKILETSKYELNLSGKWVATAEPEIEFYVSYLLNGLTIPPGFITWVDLVREFLEACPPGGKVDTNKLKTFLNIRMGQTWEELGESPKVHQLMQNTREYKPGIVPDVTCERDGNKSIVILTLSCDLNGIMEQGNEDVRIDWELLAHAATGVTYSVDQGSIGSFKRKRDKSKIERERDGDRKRWTYMHKAPNSVWPEFLKLIEKNWVCESGNEMNAVLTVIDTGFFTRLAKDFIESFSKRTELVIGIKGSTELDFRRTNKDTPRVRRSREQHNIYILEVNQIKDELSSYMKLRLGNDDFQPDGFMNYPQQEGGKYSMKNYFIHYEGEKRSEVLKDGNVVGFKWDKKTSDSQNHFWDVRIYGLAAKEIYIDMLKRSDPKLKELTWAEFALMMSN
jgi:phage terminase large subunit GpA-like protein